MKEKTIYALGFFDGVHLGHQALLKACKALANGQGSKAAAVTFATHPDTLVLGKTPGLINTIEDRVRLLKAFGMDEVVVELVRCKTENETLRYKMNELNKELYYLKNELNSYKNLGFGLYVKKNKNSSLL